jgi:hypothetical protein
MNQSSNAERLMNALATLGKYDMSFGTEIAPYKFVLSFATNATFLFRFCFDTGGTMWKLFLF